MLRYCHAVHILVEQRVIERNFLVLTERRTFGRVKGMFSTSEPQPFSDLPETGLAEKYSLQCEPLQHGVCIIWMIFENIALDRTGLNKIYPVLVKSLSHLFDFRCLYHYYDGNLKQWGKARRPLASVKGDRRVRPTKIDKDPLMLVRTYQPSCMRLASGDWYSPALQIECAQITFERLYESGKKALRVKDDAGGFYFNEKIPTYEGEYKFESNQVDPKRAVLLFVRTHSGEPGRNTQPMQIELVHRVAAAMQLQVVLAGQPDMDSYAKSIGRHLQAKEISNRHYLCLPYQTSTFLEQMQTYASFLCAVGNNASALDLASGASLPTLRDLEFAAAMRSQNYERCHNSYLRNSLNLGIAPWAVLEQEESTHLKEMVAFGERSYDPTSGRYPALKTHEDLGKILFFFLYLCSTGHSLAKAHLHVTLPDDFGKELSRYDCQALIDDLNTSEKGVINDFVNACMQLCFSHAVKVDYLQEADRTRYRRYIDPNNDGD